VEDNEALQQRIKDAANYFSREINKWKIDLSAHPFEIKTKKVSNPIDQSLVELNTIVNEILKKIDFCKNGFALTAYADNNRKPLTGMLPMRTSYLGNNPIGIINKGAGNPNLYNRINELRKGYAKENRVTASKIFGDRVIEKICQNLPCDRESLVAIKGVSANKIRQYADEIVETVIGYCKENNIEPKKIDKADTVKDTLRLLKTGKTVKEIAQERSLVESTVEGHLAKAISAGLIQINEVMPLSEAQNIANYFTPDGEKVTLTGIRERVPAEISWGKLRMVLAWLQREQD